MTGTATNAKFVIPPGDGNYEVRSTWTAPADVRIIDLMPHRHVLGKDFTYHYPRSIRMAASQVVLQVARLRLTGSVLYQFKEPLFLPRAQLDCVADFDTLVKEQVQS